MQEFTIFDGHFEKCHDSHINPKSEMHLGKFYYEIVKDDIPVGCSIVSVNQH